MLYLVRLAQLDLREAALLADGWNREHRLELASWQRLIAPAAVEENPVRWLESDLAEYPETIHSALRMEASLALAHIDPMGILSELGAAHSSLGIAIKSAVRELAKSDPSALATWLSNTKLERFVAEEFTNELIRQWGTSDPEAARAWLHSLKDSRHKTQLHFTLLFAQASVDGSYAEVFGEVDKLARSSDRHGHLMTWADGWARRDPRAAAEWVSTRTSGTDRLRLLGEIAKVHAADHPSEALELLAPFAKEIANQSWAGSTRIVFPGGKTSGVSLGLGGSSPEGVLNSILRTLAQDDPRAVLEFTREHRPEEITGYLSENEPAYLALRRWANDEPRAAAEWVLANSGQGAPGRVLGIVNRIWHVADFDGFLGFVNGLTDPGQRDAMISPMVANLAQDNLETALQLVDLQSAEARDDSLNELVRPIAQRDPERAFALSLQIENEDVRNSAHFNLMAQYSGARLEAGKEFMRSAAAADLMPRGFENFAHAWALQEFEAAAEWARSLENPLRRDHAFAGLAGASERRDPATSLAWLIQIQNEEMRREELQSLAQDWRDHRQDEFEAEIRALDMPEDVRTLLLKPAER